MEECPSCDGTGEIHSHNPKCPTCRGSGRTTKEKAEQCQLMSIAIEKAFPKRTGDYE